MLFVGLFTENLTLWCRTLYTYIQCAVWCPKYQLLHKYIFSWVVTT